MASLSSGLPQQATHALQQRCVRPAGCVSSHAPARRARGRLQTRHALPVAELAEANLQDVIVGGFVVTCVGAALYGGLKKDPVICDLCLGTGGTKCFGCDGEGKMPIMKEDLVGPNAGPRPTRGVRRCRVCKGPGMILCSKCKGSGYMQS